MQHAGSVVTRSSPVMMIFMLFVWSIVVRDDKKGQRCSQEYGQRRWPAGVDEPRSSGPPRVRRHPADRPSKQVASSLYRLDLQQKQTEAGTDGITMNTEMQMMTQETITK